MPRLRLIAGMSISRLAIVLLVLVIGFVLEEIIPQEKANWDASMWRSTLEKSVAEGETYDSFIGRMRDRIAHVEPPDLNGEAFLQAVDEPRSIFVTNMISVQLFVGTNRRLRGFHVQVVHGGL